MSDVWDILEMGGSVPAARESESEVKMNLLKRKRMTDENKSKEDHIFSKKERNQRKPEGMSRELFALLAGDNKDSAPLISSDFSPTGNLTGGYKQVKAKLGLKKVRKWKWMPFQNPGRTDGFMLNHWRRVGEEGREYQFARFATKVAIPAYNDVEYQQLLNIDNWTKGETDHLFSLCRRFDLRFIVIQDRWDKINFPIPRTVEDLKERYYSVVNILTEARTIPGQELKIKYFDADHERRRKEQLTKLYDRTSDQVEEEQKLLEELRRIEMRKKEREKKTQDLQKLITAADKSADRPDVPANKQGRGRKRNSQLYKNVFARNSDLSSSPNASALLESVGIKFPDVKSSGVGLRSQKMKLPGSVGTKKSKAIEQLLVELNVDLKPMPTEEICQHFNELRSDMVLLYELKMALASSEFELQTLKHQYEALQGRTGEVDGTLFGELSSTRPLGSETPKKTISEVIDVESPGSRKRKAALEQGNLLRKLKKT
ncbi:DNA methyltransferase 1 associated protein 1 isoform X2 [Brevipalpus obovatus]|uniref:DNA methyltransferase 1 associated protein 1 isoform X2 n=1 Tax=Brevipalpus obovatus TaxID=246614 RepID=UPI003D9E6CAA